MSLKINLQSDKAFLEGLMEKKNLRGESLAQNNWGRNIFARVFFMDSSKGTKDSNQIILIKGLLGQVKLVWSGGQGELSPLQGMPGNSNCLASWAWFLCEKDQAGSMKPWAAKAQCVETRFFYSHRQTGGDGSSRDQGGQSGEPKAFRVLFNLVTRKAGKKRDYVWGFFTSVGYFDNCGQGLKKDRILGLAPRIKYGSSLVSGYDKARVLKFATGIGRLDYSIKNRIKDLITGLNQGYTMSLELRGIGFKASILNGKGGKPFISRRALGVGTISWADLVSVCLKKKENPIGLVRSVGTGPQSESQMGSTLVMKLGLSHDVKYCSGQGVQKGIKLDIMDGTNGGTVGVFGISPWAVNQIAHEIHALKKPEPYKGKGIRYSGEKFYGLKKGRSSRG